MDNTYSSYLNYNGHGMIERYPRDMSLLHTTSHERRHVVHNQLYALATGKEVSQEVSYKVSISSDYRVIVEGAITDSITRDNSSLFDSSKAAESADLNAQLARTNRKVDELSAEYMDVKGSASKESGNTTIALDSGESKSIKRELVRLEGIIKSLRGELAISSLDTTDPASSKGEMAKEDHISLRLSSKEVAESFKFSESGAPGIVLNDGVGSAISVAGTLKRLSEESRLNFPFVNFRFEKSEAYQGVRTDAFNRFGDKLFNLREGASSIASRDVFNIHEGESSAPDSVTITPSFDSRAGDYSVDVASLAQGERIVSDEISDPYASLGVSGSFKINGYSVSVDSSDSLYDIKNKINYGEDSNRNGNLDYAEDINGNGAIDSVYIQGVETSAGYIDAFFLYEDINANGVLDGSEDLNGNNHLDGGTLNTGVTASIERNRLVLDNVASNAIHLSDNDGLLAGIGFYAEDRFGVYRKRESVLLSDGTDLNIEASKLQLEVDGKSYNRPKNIIDDIISEATVEIRNLPSAAVDITIRNNYARPVKRIESFVDSYNKFISHLNDDALSNGFLSSDSRLQRVRSNLVRGVTEAASVDALSPSEIGLNIVGGKSMFSQLSLANLERLRANKGNPPSLPTSGEGTLLGGLRKIGITNRMNDTLTIDYDRLSSAIKRELSDVVETLSGVNGVSSRITEETAKALDPVGGSIMIQKEFKEERGLDSFKAANSSFLNRERLGRLLDSFI